MPPGPPRRWRGCSPIRYRSPPARWSSAARCYGHLLTPNVVTGASGQAGYGFESSGVTALPAILDHTPLTAPGTWTTPPDRAAW
ncbi:hypothetical protein [Streptomyces albidoflavus]|uniref:hypothetical protein n=1 Tax=Streptomyces albidoflavus TaxID=1886 RepID=UPI0034535E20